MRYVNRAIGVEGTHRCPYGCLVPNSKRCDHETGRMAGPTRSARPAQRSTLARDVRSAYEAVVSKAIDDHWPVEIDGSPITDSTPEQEFAQQVREDREKLAVERRLRERVELRAMAELDSDYAKRAPQAHVFRCC